VRDTPYAGISVGWIRGGAGPPAPWQFIVRANVVEDIGNGVLSDFAGIYLSIGGDDSGTCEAKRDCYLPTLVDGNLVRNVRGYNYGGAGAYTDENVAGVTFQNNALGNVSGAGLYLHCGLDLTARNNIFWGNFEPAGASFRGGTAIISGCNTGGVDPQFANVSGAVATNIFLLTVPRAALFERNELGWSNISFSSNVWWAAPPLDPARLRWPDARNEDNRTFAQWQAAGNDVGGAVADPLVAALGSDFALRPGSPALARGFRQLEQAWGPRP